MLKIFSDGGVISVHDGIRFAALLRRTLTAVRYSAVLLWNAFTDSMMVDEAQLRDEKQSVLTQEGTAGPRLGDLSATFCFIAL